MRLTVGDGCRLKLKPPFDGILPGNHSKVIVIGERTIAEIGAIDVWEEIYKPLGVSRADYIKDVEDGIMITVLATEDGRYLYVPSKYIDGVIKEDTVTYSNKVILVNIGYLPDNIGLSNAENIIKDDIKDALGVMATSKVLTLGNKIEIPTGKYNMLEKIRKAAITTMETYKVKYSKMVIELARVKKIKDKLECTIVNKCNKC